jgi:type I restriction enzyme M protein
MNRDELRNTISNACDIMRRKGLTTMDYMEQLSWLLFLKSFEETQQEIEAMTGAVLERAFRGEL